MVDSMTCSCSEELILPLLIYDDDLDRVSVLAMPHPFEMVDMNMMTFKNVTSMTLLPRDFQLIKVQAISR